MTAFEGGAGEPSDTLLPGKAGDAAAVRRTLASTICRIADPTLVARPRQLRDASTVMRFRPAHQSRSIVIMTAAPPALPGRCRDDGRRTDLARLLSRIEHNSRHKKRGPGKNVRPSEARDEPSPGVEGIGNRATCAPTVSRRADYLKIVTTEHRA
jgi:hypothetical protein